MKNKIFFSDASSLLKENQSSFSYGVCIFDIDNDNEPEILIANSRSGNKIYKFSEEENAFVDVAPESFQYPKNDTVSLCVGDFLGNGSPAVYQLHSDTFGGLKNIYDNLLVRTSADKSSPEFFDLLSQQSNISNPYSGRSIGAVDVEGTGKHGFFVVNYDAPSLFYSFNSKKEMVEEISQDLGLRQFCNGRSIVAQPILKENSVDIYVGNEDGPNHFYTKNSKGFYTEKAQRLGLEENLFQARGITVADFDGNGLLDVVIGNSFGMNSIYMQKEMGHFENLPPALFREPMSIRNILVADFDNDGNEEIFVHNHEEANRMFRYLGENEWEEIEIGELRCEKSHGTGAAYGDLTGNGFLDIVLTAGDTQKDKNHLFLGIPNGNKWLRIQPLTQNKFPALSAKVRIFCHNAKHQTKVICSGSGYLCQMEPVAHFGFGPEFPNIDRIEITWPGKDNETPIKTILSGKNIQPNTLIQIPYPKNEA